MINDAQNQSHATLPLYKTHFGKNTLYKATPVAFAPLTGPSRSAAVASLEAVILAQLLFAEKQGLMACHSPSRNIKNIIFAPSSCIFFDEPAHDYASHHLC